MRLDSPHRAIARRGGHAGTAARAALGALALGVVGVSLLLVVRGTGPPRSGLGPATGPLLFGLLGLAVRDEDGDAVERLTAKIERFEAGEAVDFATDRDDEIGELYEAVGDLAASAGAGERASEPDRDRFEALFENASDAIAHVDLTDGYGRVRAVNDRFVDVFGYDRAEAIDRPLLDLVGPTDGELDREQLREQIEGGGHVRHEVTRETAGGSREFVARFVPIGDERPPSEGFAVYTDVTERKERERQLEALVQNTNAVTYIKDRDGVYQFANEAAGRFFGEGPEAMIGSHDDELFEEAAAAEIREHDRHVMETGETISEEVVRPIEGEEHVFLDNKYPYRDETGEIVGVMGISRDITDRKEAERELRETKERLQKFIERAPVGVAALDEDGTVTLWNDGMERIFGWTAAEAVGNPYPPVPDDDGANHASLVERAWSGESLSQIELARETKDGTRIHVTLSTAPIYDETGSITEVVSFVDDITERVEHERELERTTDLLEQAQRLGQIGAWEIDATTDPPELTLSDEANRIHGLAPDADLGVDEALGFYHPDDRERIEEALERAIEEGEPYDIEAKFVTADGDERRVRSIGEPIRRDGDVVKVRGSIQDVTERTARERELAARAAAMESSIDGMAILGENEEYVFVNQAHAELYRYDDPAAMVGETWRICYSDAELERFEEEVVPRLYDEGGWRGEAIGTRADGEEFPQELSLTALDDGRLICVVRDVTDRKERQAELERTTDLLQRVQEIARVGGWELDVTVDPPEEVWTEEMYRLHGLPANAEVDIETIVERYHPDDRARVRRTIEESIESGTGYDLEARLQIDGGTRWVRALADPIREDGEVVKIRGSIQDVTEQKDRELALQSLHEATRGLLGTETAADVADLVVDAAADVLDVAGVAVYLLDAGSNRLEPAAVAGGFGEASAVGAGEGDSLLWNCFLTGAPTVFDETEAADLAGVLDSDLGGGLLVPLGDHGVFVVATRDPRVEAATRRLVETLVATTEAALDRIASEESLREREGELAERNQRLRRQIQINDIIRTIHGSLIGAESREEIERAVCDGLLAAEGVTFAWIGDLDPADERLTPRAWAGGDGEYLDAIDLETDAATPDPSVRAARAEEPAVVPNLVDGLKDEPWRQAALARDFHAAVSVPLTYDEYFYGVLSVYADEPDSFGDLERAVFAELGESIANAITTVQTRAALHADTFTELSLRLDRDDSLLGRVAGAVDGAVRYDGLADAATDESRLFFTVDDADAGAIEDALDGLVAVSAYRIVDESDGECLVEVTVSGDLLPARAVRHGGRPQSMRTAGGAVEATVDVPTATDVREFVEMLAEQCPSVELTGRRDVTRGTHTRRELVNELFAELTDRQLEVLKTAYFAGFFAWPRTSSGEDVAAMLDVSQPTVNRHIRLAQQRLLAQLFEGRVDPEGG